ncbi:MAG TPA: NAD(P)H-hydrate dehydratase, partial [Candidatus Saccharimonadales bacterium]|nr:NAD(P)H-hydrate dehydratase [Candidatus Saccharimonadales bacterium]
VSNQTALNAVTGQEAGITFPPREDDAHKGEFGHVLVVGGSLGKAGAAGLAGMAALNAGAGLVTVACPKSIQATVAGFAPELMTEGLPETEEGSISMAADARVDALLSGKDAVVLGPGISGNEQTARFVRRMVTQSSLPLVLDADGLNAFSGHYGELQSRGEAAPLRVLTPHPGEAARLLGVSAQQINAERREVAQRIAMGTGSCVVLKGHRTIVAGVSGETWINMSGNPALAKGGSGDVLAGIIGAALARKRGPRLPPSPASESSNTSAFLKDLNVAGAVYLHGLAGDLARDRLHEHTVLATDVVESLTDAFRECQLQTDRGLFYLQR